MSGAKDHKPTWETREVSLLVVVMYPIRSWFAR